MKNLIKVFLIFVFTFMTLSMHAKKAIVFANAFLRPAEIFTVNLDGSNLIQLTNSGSQKFWPKMSPDGTRIAFVGNDTGVPQVYIMNKDGSDLHRLTNIPNTNNWGKLFWSPDGNTILLSIRVGSVWQLFRVDPNTGSHSLFSSELSRGWDYHHSDYSPDGQNIVIKENQPFNDYVKKIGIINSDGTDYRIVLYDAFRPQWSPDGSEILVLQFSDVIRGYHIMNVYSLTEEGNLIFDRSLDNADSLNEFDPNWYKDGYVYFRYNSNIWRIIGSGGSKEEMLDLNIDIAYFDIYENDDFEIDAGSDLQIYSEEQLITSLEGNAITDIFDNMQYRWIEGTIVLLDWTDVGSSGEANLDMGLMSEYLAEGVHTLILEVRDGENIKIDTMILTIFNSPPSAAPIGAGTYEINSPASLSGSISDFDGDLINFKWLENGIVLNGGNIQANFGGEPVSLPEFVKSDLSVGTHTIVLEISDGKNPTISKEILIEITDTGDPTLAPVADKSILWPPNHQMVDIAINANASDNSGSVFLSATITSNEAVNGTGDGDVGPDWTTPIIDQETGIIKFQLRAERSGLGDGRIYTIKIIASDLVGNTSEALVEVIVPHSKSKK